MTGETKKHSFSPEPPSASWQAQVYHVCHHRAEQHQEQPTQLSLDAPCSAENVRSTGFDGYRDEHQHRSSAAIVVPASLFGGLVLHGALRTGLRRPMAWWWWQRDRLPAGNGVHAGSRVLVISQ